MSSWSEEKLLSPFKTEDLRKDRISKRLCNLRRGTEREEISVVIIFTKEGDH